MSERANRQVILVNRPRGRFALSDFEVRSAATPEPGPGEFQIRVEWLSIDPVLRLIAEESMPLGSAELGETVPGHGIGTVTASRHEEFSVGQVVDGWFGWQEHAVTDGLRGMVPVRALAPGTDPQLAMTTLGSSGLTGYVGLTEVGRPLAGEVVAVSAAASGSGLVAAQTARLLGCAVIGITGSDAKRRWLTDVARIEHTINYRTEDVESRLSALAPDGVDVFFDNAGGGVLDAVLARLAPGARVVINGGLTWLYDGGPVHGLRNYALLPLTGARLEGFSMRRYLDKAPAALAQLEAWVGAGELRTVADVVDGLDAAPRALLRVFDGENLGKQLVRLADGRS